jgi:hypothetical protein
MKMKSACEFGMQGLDKGAPAFIQIDAQKAQIAEIHSTKAPIAAKELFSHGVLTLAVTLALILLPVVGHSELAPQ